MNGLCRKWNTAFRIFREEGLAEVLRTIYVKLSGKLGMNVQYAIWRLKNETGKKEEPLPFQPLLSVIVPVYNVRKRYLEACIQSVLHQTYKNWELCIVDDCSTASEVKQVLQKFSGRDKIKMKYRKENGRISRASNDAVAMAAGDFIVLLDCDDTLGKNALYEVAKKLNEIPDCNCIYSDEDKISPLGRRHTPFFKPDWSPDTLMSLMYTCHLTVYRKSIFLQAGGMRPEFDGAQDYDLMLRVTECTGRIVHIPQILYHWREHGNSTAKALNAKPYADIAARKAKEEALFRRNQKGTVEFLEGCQQWNVVYAVKPETFVSIIILSKDNTNMLRLCLDSILRTARMHYEIIVWDNGSGDACREESRKLCKGKGVRYFYEREAFNFSRQCNKAAAAATGSLLLFLNDDIEAVEPGWLERLAGHAMLPHVGAAGAKLYYPESRRIQHCGIITLRSGPSHAFYGMEDKRSYYFQRNCCVYNYSAVTGACLMIRKEVFEKIGGFDTDFPVAYNDVDLCYRLLEAGYYNVVRTDVALYHYESASRGRDNLDQKKKNRLKAERELLRRKHTGMKSDPFYSIHLTQDRVDFRIK